jgi:quercetin dioxygenase-like cupin family protein
MKLIVPADAARTALSANPDRPATAVLLDTPDARLVVFRLAPGQAVAAHRSTSSVLLTVVSGSGVLSGEGVDGVDERSCSSGEWISYEPNELHGMRALHEELVVLATITPRPGSR